MNELLIQTVALQFGLPEVARIESFSGGLIHHTYKVESTNHQAIIIQAINTHVFQKPERIISNYRNLHAHLFARNFLIAAPICSTQGQWLLRDEQERFWRAQEFIADSYSEKLVTPEKAFQAARCFASFAQALSDLDITSLEETISQFHDLRFRYQQLLQAISNTSEERLKEATPVIDKVFSRSSLLAFYDSILTNNYFKKRIMHHDCKLTNILFNSQTHLAICPVDLDTTMPGYFFSDVGDMIRSMTPSLDENSTNWNALTVQKEIYQSIIEGYRLGIGSAFTSKENEHIHHAGLIMIFMQGIRFLTDYLSNDRYYKISYPDQNLNRAKNQLILLEKIELLLKEEYQYNF